MPASARVIHLAFDACDREIVASLAAADELPTFAALLREAAVADVEPPPGVYISANWPSFTTGLAPSSHDYLSWVDVDPVTYEWSETSPRDMKGTPFWSALVRAGRRVCVFDVPHALVDPTLAAATQIVEWGCHDRHLGPASAPPQLIERIDREIGPHPIGEMTEQRPLNFAPCDFAHRAGPQRTVDEAVRLWEDLLVAVDRKEAASLALLDEGGWDLYSVVFGESHCVGHQLWAAHDPSHRRHDPNLVALIGDPVREMYRRLDAVLARHLERADADTTVYVHLSHGMGPHYDGTHLLDEVLHRLHAAASARRGWRSRLLGATVGALPPDRQARLLGVLQPAMQRSVDRRPPGPSEPWAVPLAERPWFQVPNNAVGGIRINRQGREACGVVPSDRYREVCQELRRWLEEIVNLDTGEPLVHRVLLADEVHTRHPADRLPDLFVEWTSSGPIERVYSPRIGVVVAHDTQWRTGDHRRHGRVFVRGPGITAGRRAAPLRTEDLGVTLSAALGVTLEDVDGRVAADLLPGSGVGADRRTPPDVPTVPSGPVERGFPRLAAEHRATRELARHAELRARQLDHRVNLAAAELDAHELRLRDLERAASVRAVTEWVRGAEVPEDVAVSVVLPTRDRADLVPRAVESVLAQAYRRLELLVVDDGSVDATPEVLAKYDDPRLRVVAGDGRGVCAARNLALEVLNGDLVVYLDDDNTMTPWWCKAVVWAFGQHPSADVLYGARLIDDIVRARAEGDGAWPSVQFEPFDFDVLTQHNFADINVLAHRAGLPDAVFDESLSTYGDWDLFWRLTRPAPPLELPVVACHYRTDTPGRLSTHPDDLLDRDAVRRKFDRLLAADGAAPDH